MWRLKIEIENNVSGNTRNIVQAGSDRAPRVLFAGGGTGGHVYPAIAIARSIKSLVPAAVVEFAGTTSHIEWRVVPEAGFKIHPITVSPLHRSLTLRNLSFPIKLLRGLLQSRSLVRKFKPDLAVGTGGYVSGPVLWAASKAGVKTVVQEQNAFAGKTNKMLATKAAEIHIAFEEAASYFPGTTCKLSGNPVRKELLDSSREAGRSHFGIDAEKKVVLMFGGSLGSAAMNAVFADRYLELLADPKIVLIWQTGGRYFDRYQDSLEKHPRLKLLKYIERMDHAYAAADVVVCRAGAISCSEIELTGSPSILVPSPNVAEDHQTYNARSLSGDGAAVLLPEAKLSGEIVHSITSLLDDDEGRAEMKRKLLARARPDAADTIARSILALAGVSPDTFRLLNEKPAAARRSSKRSSSNGPSREVSK